METEKNQKRIVIYGGGTITHVTPHLALSAPAYGTTAKFLAEKATKILPKMTTELVLKKMAGGIIEANHELASHITKQLDDHRTKIIIMSAAICDFDGHFPGKQCGKYGERLKSDSVNYLTLIPSEKIISKIRKNRKDIFLVGFKATSGLSEDEQYIEGLNLCKQASCNLVFANDVTTRKQMIITPEEARYGTNLSRGDALIELLEICYHRTHLTFTKSTVVSGTPIPWISEEIPESLKTVVNYCISKNAYKPFNGATAGHFACKVNDNTFLTSIRKTNFNDIEKLGLVKVVTDGPDSVIAYGAKPSVGGQSQRIVFSEHNNLDCIVHFHCPIKEGSSVPRISQREFECGSHECGQRTSRNLKTFGNLKAVYLENHGPNIVFNRRINPEEVIKFIENNFDLSQKTGGFCHLREKVSTSNTLETAINIM